MNENLSNTKKIAKNSLLLYFRMAFVMLVNLYTIRIVLKTLGSQDYGIFDVVAGVISMLVSLSSVLSSSTQRFYSLLIGEKNYDQLKVVFSASLKIHVLLSVGVIILAETLGVWFINTQLVIPHERINSANWVFQFSIFSFVFTFLHVPYSAAMIAHENLAIFTAISTAESLLKLFAALSLASSAFDKLAFYGFTLFLISALVFLAYFISGYYKYNECRFQKSSDKSFFYKLLSFSGWSLFGSVAGIGITQVVSVLINIFFGPIASSSRAISLQFNLMLSSLTASFLMAIRPQMIKSYAEKSFTYLNKMFYVSNKLIFYGLLIICLPLFFEMPIVLKYWLGIFDKQAILFSRLVVIYTLIISLNNPISIIIHATGHVREYHFWVELLMLFIVPITYIFYNQGFPAVTTYFVLIISSIICHLVRLVCLNKFYCNFDYKEYFLAFLIPAILITSVVAFLVYYLSVFNFSEIIRAFLTPITSLTLVVAFVYKFNLSIYEKAKIKHIFLYLKSKLR